MTRAEFHIFKERSLNQFCYEVVRHESIDIRRERERRLRKEINFSAVAPSVLEQLATEDQYHKESHVFYVQGIIPIIVADELLANALSFLVNPLREVILLYYFLDLKFSSIALLLKIPASTVTYRFNSALDRLRAILENLLNEE